MGQEGDWCGMGPGGRRHALAGGVRVERGGGSLSKGRGLGGAPGGHATEGEGDGGEEHGVHRDGEHGGEGPWGGGGLEVGGGMGAPGVWVNQWCGVVCSSECLGKGGR